MPLLIVGLGNPGHGYVKTRHNAGFWLLDALANAYECQFLYKKKFDADEVAIGASTRLLKPQTFMNNSGMSVLAAAHFYRIAPPNILVVHDEVDLAVGVVKLKLGGGNAGHNGLRDISQRLGCNDFWRVRIGVGRPTHGEINNYVLGVPPMEEQDNIDGVIDRLLGCWDLIMRDDYNNAMAVLHSDNK